MIERRSSTDKCFYEATSVVLICKFAIEGDEETTKWMCGYLFSAVLPATVCCFKCLVSHGVNGFVDAAFTHFDKTAVLQRETYRRSSRMTEVVGGRDLWPVRKQITGSYLDLLKKFGTSASWRKTECRALHSIFGARIDLKLLGITDTILLIVNIYRDSLSLRSYRLQQSRLLLASGTERSAYRFYLSYSGSQVAHFEKDDWLHYLIAIE